MPYKFTFTQRFQKHFKQLTSQEKKQLKSQFYHFQSLHTYPNPYKPYKINCLQYIQYIRIQNTNYILHNYPNQLNQIFIIFT